MNTCHCCHKNSVAVGNLCRRCYERIVRPEFRVKETKKK